jgi:C1A family cysteine protease
MLGLGPQAIAVGGSQKIPPASVPKDILDYALQFIETSSNSVFASKVIDVIHAEKQIVAGVLYMLTLKLATTKCIKRSAGRSILDSCPVNPSEVGQQCHVKVWVKPWQNFKDVSDVHCSKRDEIEQENVVTVVSTQEVIPAQVNFSVIPNIRVGLRMFEDKQNIPVQENLKNGDGHDEHQHNVLGQDGHNEQHLPILHQNEYDKQQKQRHSGQYGHVEEQQQPFVQDGRNEKRQQPILGQEGHSEHQLIQGQDRHHEQQHQHLLGQDEHNIRKKILDYPVHYGLSSSQAQFAPLMSSSESEKALGILQSPLSFKKFIKNHDRDYESNDEYRERYKIFKSNMKKVQFLRETERGTGAYGATQFADLTPEEFKQKHLGLDTSLKSGGNVGDALLPPADIPNVILPPEFDWRHYNVVTPVKNQGSCGSCWAFSVTGNVEGQWAIRRGKLLELSEQELVDCDDLDNGCNGGLPENAYKAIQELGGLESEDDYVYDGIDEKCHFNKSLVIATVTGAVEISKNETEMAQWLMKNGPVSIGINANAMQFYMGGISHPWKFLCSKSNLDHGVLIVGFGIHHYPVFKKTMPFWIVKNSWGPEWGEQGYYRVFRGDGTCGVNEMVTSALVG